MRKLFQKSKDKVTERVRSRSASPMPTRFGTPESRDDVLHTPGTAALQSPGISHGSGSTELIMVYYSLTSLVRSRATFSGSAWLRAYLIPIAKIP